LLPVGTIRTVGAPAVVSCDQPMLSHIRAWPWLVFAGVALFLAVGYAIWGSWWSAVGFGVVAMAFVVAWFRRG